MIQLSKKLNINKKFIFLGILSFLLISLKFSNPIFIQKISNINYDFYQSNFVKGKIDNITIIDIDEKSIDTIGQFPWRRDVYATIFKNLKASGAKVIAVDIFFSENDKQNPTHLLRRLQKENNNFPTLQVIDTQQIFIDSLKTSNVVLPVLGQIKEPVNINSSKPKIRIIEKGGQAKNYLYQFPYILTSLKEINEVAAGIGSISLLPSLDGVIRSIPLLVNIGGQIWPSLSLESLRLFNNEKNLLIEIDGKGIHTIKTRETFFSTDENGLLNIKFKKFNKDNYISAIDIINGIYDEKKINNKIILLGASAQGIFDFKKIANGKIVAGVEVHAHVIDNIINNDFINKGLASKVIENSLLFVSIFLLIYLPIKIKPVWSISIFISYILVINGISTLLFLVNYYADPLYNTLAGALIFTTSLYFKYLDENILAIEHEKKQLLLKKEREIAGEVQKKLFPSDKKIEKYIYANNTPAKDVSGDYYDYYENTTGEIYFTLADVSGKGIKAGILMANAASVFRSLTKMNASVSTTAQYINNQVADSSYQGMFITAVIGKINIEKSEMEFINLGHEPMMVISKDLSFEYIKSSVPPLGIMNFDNDSFFKTTTISIKDKTVFIYTDGVTEGYISPNIELTVPGLEKEIRQLNSRSPNIIAEHIKNLLTKSGSELRDDITCLGISI
jgi:adenylate cyclase|tara:strand:- start:4014 stop:6041 length:2028 start_codon:yes stop_codon:yes gene_type:complete